MLFVFIQKRAILAVRHGILIEAMPVLTGVVLLNIAIYQKEKVTAYAA